jgi:hypothetical protein
MPLFVLEPLPYPSHGLLTRALVLVRIAVCELEAKQMKEGKAKVVGWETSLS